MLLQANQRLYDDKIQLQIRCLPTCRFTETIG